MKVAILGTGVVGRKIATRLLELGHDVVIGTRDVESTLNKTEKEGYAGESFKEWHEANNQIQLATFKDAAEQAEVIFNCTGGQVTLKVLDSIGSDVLGNKTLIDLANPLDFSNGMPPSLNPVNTDSLGEQIQRTYPNVRVVKTLNTMSAMIMVNPTLVSGDHNVFVCGNDETAKSTVKSLLGEMGWKQNQILDLGDISNSRGTEMLLPIWLRLWGALGTAEFNFHIQRNA